MEPHERVANVARAFKPSLRCLALSCLLMPGAVLAANTHVTRVVAPGNLALSDIPTIIDGPDKGTGAEQSACKGNGVFLPKVNQAVTVTQNGIPTNKGVSDNLMVSSGTIAVERAGEGSNDLVPALTSGIAVTERPERTTKPVARTLLATRGGTLGTTTVVFFNDGAPEPGTMLLFGTGLLAFGAILRRKKKIRSETVSVT